MKKYTENELLNMIQEISDEVSTFDMKYELTDNNTADMAEVIAATIGVASYNGLKTMATTLYRLLNEE